MADLALTFSVGSLSVPAEQDYPTRACATRIDPSNRIVQASRAPADQFLLIGGCKTNMFVTYSSDADTCHNKAPLSSLRTSRILQRNQGSSEDRQGSVPPTAQRTTHWRCPRTRHRRLSRLRLYPVTSIGALASNKKKGRQNDPLDNPTIRPSFRFSLSIMSVAFERS